MSHLQRMKQAEELALIDPPNGLTAFETAFTLFYVQGNGPCSSVQQAAGRRGQGMSDIQMTRLARKLLKNPNVQQYLRDLQKRLEDKAVAGTLEILMFLTEAIRTPINDIDGDHKLCQKRKVTTHQGKDGSSRETVELEMVPKMDALKMLAQMKGLNAPLQVDHRHAMAVMLVPMTNDVDEWEGVAKTSQQALMDDARKI